LNPKKRNRERVRKDSRREVKINNIWGKARSVLYLAGCKERLVEGTQAMPVRPSDKDRMKVKMLGWWVGKA
jgi:hypothetical protein